MRNSPEDRALADLERTPRGEPADMAAIVRAILTIQARTALQRKEPLARGTHAKGTAVRAEFEVLGAAAAGRDPALAARLAKGIFAQPGKYPAVVRFANAVSAPAPDTNPDVRAMSFSIRIPDGLLAPGMARLDYSLNSATTFPMNDAHSFAVFIGVLSANGMWGIAKALWALPLKDLYAFFKVAFLGVLQQRQTPKLAYQQLRYWSTTPYLHGSSDAVKYSATPAPTNPSQFRRAGDNCLQDELARHVNQDERMSAWDFGLQFLDAGRMTRRGRRREASFWIENATVEWNEDQAPFHTVARLRLLPKSVLSPEETAAQHIDVTDDSTVQSQPLGGVNRARWGAENASRAARLGGVADMPPAAAPVHRPWYVSVLRWGVVGYVSLLLLGYAAGLAYRWAARGNVPPLERVDSVAYLDQGWGTDADAASRQVFYYTPQGASLLDIRYSWFVNLERPFRSTRLADPEHLRQLNFIVDPVPTRANPDQLPVGLARRYDPELRDFVLDVTCAACHTGQLNVVRPLKSAPEGGPKSVTTAIRIDGGQAMIAFTDSTMGSFIAEVIGGFADTLAHPLKFNRFANGVLGRDAGLANKFRLWMDVAGVVRRAVGLAWSGGYDKRFYPTQEGYGRTAAIGRIANVVFGDHVDPANYRTFRSPESFPYLWNIWKFDWEQYGAFVAQPMARNVAESLGTGAAFRLFDNYGRPLPPAERYRTSFAFENVERIESTLWALKPPAWPQSLLGAIDIDKAKAGRRLFVGRCQGCHGPHPASLTQTRIVAPGKLASNGDSLPLWQIRLKPLDVIGTDPMVSRELVGYRVDLTRIGLDPADVKRLLGGALEEQKKREEEAHSDSSDADRQLAEIQQLDLRSVSIGEGLNILDMVIRERYYAGQRYSASEQACLNGFGMLDLPAVALGYKPRPLEGVWATPPFLHNGSVPTLYDLLSENRPNRFYVGTRQFDPVRVGYVAAADPGATPIRGEFLFDTTVTGNSNRGHEFNGQFQNGGIGPKFTEEQKWDLIEYLKIHRDDLDVVDYIEKNHGQYPPAPVPRNLPDCSASLNARR